MSLLLDALKKAADDKQKASQASSLGADSSNTHSNDARTTSVTSDEVQPSIEELTLEDDDTEQGNLTLEEKTPVSNGDKNSVVNIDSDELSLEQNYTDSNVDKAGFSVSDDALSMLIYKSNHDVKRSKRVLLAGVFLMSLTVLVLGGVYYYLDMQAEIATLERKHQIAMQSMQSKTSKEKTPDKSDIIRNLVSDSDLEEKVRFAKERVSTRKQDKAMALAEKSTAKRNVSAAEFSIKKTNTSDPVGEKLDTAWLAYENGQYNAAKNLYKNVLSKEENNRDALLGLGAIAVREKNNSIAQKIYLSLLKQDPRDPVATAALASLQNDSSSSEKYLLSTIQKNPQAPYLNFALGNVYAQQNKWKAAQQYYFNAWQFDNENADYIYNLAVSMDQLSKQQQAINLYKDSLHKSINKQVSFSREAVQKRINELSGL